MKTCHYLPFALVVVMLCGCTANVRVQPISHMHMEAGSQEGLPLHVVFVVEETQYKPSGDSRNRIISGPPSPKMGLAIWREAFTTMGAVFQKSTAPTPSELSHSYDHDAIAHVKLRYGGAFPGIYTSSIEVRIEGAHAETLFEEVAKIKEYRAFNHVVSWDKAADVIRQKIKGSITIRKYAVSRNKTSQSHVPIDQEPMSESGSLSGPLRDAP